MLMKRDVAVACALVAMTVSIAVLGGCGGGAAQHPPAAAPPSSAVAPATNPSAPGSPSTGQSVSEPVNSQAPSDPLATGWRYRFDMTAPPNDKNSITDRDFYVYFKPDTNAVHFQIENRRGVAAKILWDECSFTDVYGRTWKAVHRGTTYDRRDLPQEVTWLQPQQRYSDYLIPVDLLLDPTAATGGAQRELLPTDLRAQSLVGRIFTAKLVLGSGNDDSRIEYNAVFKIMSTYREE
jgi:hypothetical protein